MSELDRRGVEEVLREALERARGRGVRARLARHGRGRSRGRARRRHAGARRALVPRGAPGDGADRRVGAPRLARGRRGEPDPRPPERDGRARRRAGRERARRADPLPVSARNRSTAAAVSSNASKSTMWSPGTVTSVRRSPSASRSLATSAGNVYSVSSATTTASGTGRWRRRSRELAEHRHDGGRGVAVAQAPVGAGRGCCATSSSRNALRVRGARPAGDCESAPPRPRRSGRRARRSAKSRDMPGSMLMAPGRAAPLGRRGRGGRRRARAPSGPPKLWPSQVVGPIVSASSTTSARCVGMLQGGSQVDRPWPRRSAATTRNPRGTRRSSASRR